MKRLGIFVFGAALFLLGSGCAILTDGVYDTEEPKQAPTALYNQAFARYQARNYEEAKPLFQQYIGQYPDSVLYKVALYYLAHCDQMLGELKEAEMFYSRIVDTYGEDDFWGAQAMKRIKQLREVQ
ncbi:MAG: tetratricopeptide repeat protein [Candidatus Omnitrophica bacterium]|nr:tetratricopeptide repeat protein [Candidatus Omnitrophota bacterium]